jgi:hypothetical protein
MIETAVLLTGILAGFVNSMAGGGILFVFPVLLAAGLSPMSAAMTCVNAGWPGSLSAVFGYRKDLAKIKKQYFWLVIPSVVGTTIGAYLLTQTPTSTFETIIPWLVLVSVSLFAFQPQLHKHIHRPSRLRRASPIALLALLVLPVALYAGYFGAGFGFILLAILGFTKLKNVYQINGMKNFLTAVISLSCTAVFALHGGIVWHYGIPAIVGSTLGGFIGSQVAHRLSPHFTRVVVIANGLAVVSILFRDSL